MHPSFLVSNCRLTRSPFRLWESWSYFSLAISFDASCRRILHREINSKRFFWCTPYPTAACLTEYGDPASGRDSHGNGFPNDDRGPHPLGVGTAERINIK